MMRRTKLSKNVLKQLVADLENKLKKEPEHITVDSDHIEYRTFLKEEKKSTVVTGSHGYSLKSAEEDCDKEGALEKVISITFGKVEVPFLKHRDIRAYRDVLEVMVYFKNRRQHAQFYIHWYHHFTPLFFRIKRLIKKAQLSATDGVMSEIDKALAEINSNRIDNILLGKEDENAKKE